MLLKSFAISEIRLYLLISINDIDLQEEVETFAVCAFLSRLLFFS